MENEEKQKKSKIKEVFTIVKNYIVTHKYMFWILLWLVYAIWYGVLNRLDLNFHEIHLPIDDKIPFIEPFVIFYILWYVYIAFALIFTLIKSKKDFLTMVAMIFISMIASLIVCTVYPSKITFRPDSPPGHNIFSWIIQIVYDTDQPVNVFPSIHCIVTIMITVAFFFSESMKGKTLVKALFVILTIGICLSTVFIKQHSFADFLLAMGMSVPLSVFIYLVLVPHFKNDPTEEDAAPAAEEDPALETETAIEAEPAIEALAATTESVEEISDNAEVVSEDVDPSQEDLSPLPETPDPANGDKE